MSEVDCGVGIPHKRRDGSLINADQLRIRTVGNSTERLTRIAGRKKGRLLKSLENLL